MLSPIGCSDMTVRLERAQKVDDVLPLFHAQPIEGLDGLICLATRAAVVLDCPDEVGCSPVV
jgi:hypothetical protein